MAKASRGKSEPAPLGAARRGRRGGSALLVAALVGVLAVCAVCVDRGAGPDPGADATLLAHSLLREVPAQLTPRLDSAFVAPLAVAPPAAASTGPRGPRGPSVRGGAAPEVGAIYLGNLVDRDVLIPGQPVEIRHFWKVAAAPGPGLRVFTYLRGGAGDFMNLDDSPLRRAHPPTSWRAGEIFVDTQRVTLRADWRSPTATLLVGLVHAGGHAVADRVAVRNGPVRDHAVLARQFAVDLSQAPPPPGTWRAVKASGGLRIDGVGDDAAWQQVPWSADFATAEGSKDPVGRARAKLTWDDANLYLLVSVEDRDVASPYHDRDDPLWKADCVELFIDADRNQRQYVELQVNPRNAQFDSYFATTRAQPGDTSFDAGMTSQVVVRGTVDEQGDTDEGWDVELAIPWAAVKGRDPTMAVRLPPRDGDQIRLNVVRVDKRANDKNPTASSWNRITYADFHALDRMLTVAFTVPPTTAPPAASPSPAGAPGASAPGAQVPPERAAPSAGGAAASPEGAVAPAAR